MTSKKKGTWTLKFIAYKHIAAQWVDRMDRLSAEKSIAGKEKVIREMDEASEKEEALFDALCKEIEEIMR